MTDRLERNSTAWYEALDAFVAARAAQPFAWGTNDCCTFAADWVQIARGQDLVADLRGFTTARQALDLLDSLGGLLTAVTQRLGDPLPGPFAQVGDVALVRHGGDRQSIGVCVGASVAAPAADGLALVPISQAEAAWRV